MKRLLDRILVVDIEATCWNHPTPPDQENEIIEIGLCILDIKTLRRKSKESIMVKPMRSEISPFCTELTTITPDMVADGYSFAEACRHLRKHRYARQYPWASWGNYDRRQFENQCESFGVRYPFGINHLNVKTLFALKHKLPHEVGMTTALEMLGMPLNGTQHRGDDDAWNIAGILATLL